MRVSLRIPEGQRFQGGQLAPNLRFEIVCLPPLSGRSSNLVVDTGAGNASDY